MTEIPDAVEKNEWTDADFSYWFATRSLELRDIGLRKAAYAAWRAAHPPRREAVEEAVTPEMIAAGWAIVNDGRQWPPRIGSGPGLVEVYRAMRATAIRAVEEEPEP